MDYKDDTMDLSPNETPLKLEGSMSDINAENSNLNDTGLENTYLGDINEDENSKSDFETPVDQSDVHECSICAQVFAINRELQEHAESHDNVNIHECPTCALIFNNEDDLDKHRNTHEEVTSSCDSKLNFIKNTDHDDSAVYNCIICSKIFRLKAEFVVHMKQHRDTKTLEESNVEIACELDWKNVPKQTKRARSVNAKHVKKCAKTGVNQSQSSCQNVSKTEFVCVMCLDRFNLKFDLLKHQESHSDVDVYKCALCELQFARRNEFFTHAEVHNTEELSCAIFQQVFPTADELLNHGEVHESEDLNVNGSGSQEGHTRTKLFPNDKESEEHVKRIKTEDVGEDVTYVCSVCGEKFDDNQAFARHVKHHINPFKCPLCQHSCDSQEQLDCHLESHVTEGNYKCDVCSKEFLRKNNLRRHLKTHGERCHKCEVCEREFHQISDLKVHARIHSGVRPYNCSECNKSFRTCSNLNTHMVVHNNHKLFSCPKCEKTFKFNSDLKRHLRTHSNVKPYTCVICEKNFSQSCNLDSHMRTHSGEKPYNCSVCNKSFGHQCDVRRHMRTHEESKSFECSVCQKSFNRHSNLQTHMRTIHQGERPYQCNVCLKRFNQQGHLTAHSVLHSSEKPHKCLRCGAGFTRSSTLNKHMKIHDRNSRKDWISPGNNGPPVVSGFEIQQEITKESNPELFASFGTNFTTNSRTVASTNLPFKCFICDQHFNTKAEVVDHVKSHGNETNAKNEILKLKQTENDLSEVVIKTEKEDPELIS